MRRFTLRAQAVKVLFQQHRYRRELQRLSDNFGFGPIIRYGDDRWGHRR